MRKTIQPIHELTAKALDAPEALVKDVVTHQFQFLASWMRRPYKYAHLQIPEFGRFEYRNSSVYVKLRKLVKLLREEPTPELIEEFRFWWKFRLITYEYKQSRKTKSNRHGKN